MFTPAQGRSIVKIATLMPAAPDARESGVKLPWGLVCCEQHKSGQWSSRGLPFQSRFSSQPLGHLARGGRYTGFTGAPISCGPVLVDTSRLISTADRLAEYDHCGNRVAVRNKLQSFLGTLQWKRRRCHCLGVELPPLDQTSKDLHVLQRGHAVEVARMMILGAV